ncbi:hypothetical protein Vretimale_10212 [Volvox reticuliferus]|uniref:Uncharacterized protein n=1 Tax=Volvox reticuliferus TaxID=1737510 RepID=A0A8J4GE66_9CHLO|nr:hypothetical protein Vretifemale_581 [Volvox reticuliferus]GIM05835.1 hypothetical protein Vretimale_10212 [Volvox reticuliferus]
MQRVAACVSSVQPCPTCGALSELDKVPRCTTTIITWEQPNAYYHILGLTADYPETLSQWPSGSANGCPCCGDSHCSYHSPAAASTAVAGGAPTVPPAVTYRRSCGGWFFNWISRMWTSTLPVCRWIPKNSRPPWPSPR